MPDRKRVIKSIEDCVLHNHDCVECDYDGCVFKYGDCRRDLLADALALLKEQQSEMLSYIDKWIEVRQNDWTYKLKCPYCGFEYKPDGYEDGTVDDPCKVCPNCAKQLEKPE